MAYVANLESPIPLADMCLCSSSAAAVDFGRTKTFVDAADYDGTVTWYFCVDGGNNTDGADRHWYLIDHTNADEVKATITIPAVTGSHTRFFSTAFTPAAGNNEYLVRSEQTTTNNILTGSKSYILPVQVNATKTVVCIPLICGGHASNSNGNAYNVGGVDSSGSTSYVQGSSRCYSMWTKTASNWATVKASTGCVLEVVLASVNNSYTAYVSLFDVDDNAAVAGTELSVASTTLTHLTITFDWAALTDGHKFELRIKSSNGGQSAYLHKAVLKVFMSEVQKGEVYHRIGQNVSGTSATGFYQRCLWTPGNFVVPVCYFEVTGFTASDTATCSAHHANSVNSITGAEITGSSVTTTTTKGPHRSGAIAPTSAYDVFGYTDASTPVQQLSNLLLVVAWSGSESQTVAPPVTLAAENQTPAGVGAGSNVPAVLAAVGVSKVKANEVGIGATVQAARAMIGAAKVTVDHAAIFAVTRATVGASLIQGAYQTSTANIGATLAQVGGSTVQAAAGFGALVYTTLAGIGAQIVTAATSADSDVLATLRGIGASASAQVAAHFSAIPEVAHAAVSAVEASFAQGANVLATLAKAGVGATVAEVFEIRDILLSLATVGVQTVSKEIQQDVDILVESLLVALNGVESALEATADLVVELGQVGMSAIETVIEATSDVLTVVGGFVGIGVQTVESVLEAGADLAVEVANAAWSTVEGAVGAGVDMVAEVAHAALSGIETALEASSDLLVALGTVGVSGVGASIHGVVDVLVGLVQTGLSWVKAQVKAMNPFVPRVALLGSWTPTVALTGSLTPDVNLLGSVI